MVLLTTVFYMMALMLFLLILDLLFLAGYAIYKLTRFLMIYYTGEDDEDS